MHCAIQRGSSAPPAFLRPWYFVADGSAPGVWLCFDDVLFLVYLPFHYFNRRHFSLCARLLH